jgi:hypothetical protein
MPATSRLLLLVIVACWAAFGLAGCQRYPKTPELTLIAVERAIASADGLAAWKIIDPETRQAVESVMADERQAQTLVKAKYPPSEAARELLRLAAADEVDAAHFFARTASSWSELEGYRGRLGGLSGPVLTRDDGPDKMWVKRTDGKAFHLVKRNGGWAWMDLRAEWALEKDRASHALQTLRDNAKLYQQSAEPQK